MNREILFRGKRDPKYGTGWCYGVPYIDHEGDCIMVTSISRRCVIEETVGQFTGLYDSTKWEALSKSEQKEWLKGHTADEWKGRRIFEGDIVKYIHEPGEGFWNANQTSVIVWDSTGFKLDGIMGTNKYALLGGWLVSIPCSPELFEVIGNIHDNPELLHREEKNDDQ